MAEVAPFACGVSPQASELDQGRCAVNGLVLPARALWNAHRGWISFGSSSATWAVAGLGLANARCAGAAILRSLFGSICD